MLAKVSLGLDEHCCNRELREPLAARPLGPVVREVLRLALLSDRMDELVGRRQMVKREQLDRVARPHVQVRILRGRRPRERSGPPPTRVRSSSGRHRATGGFAAVASRPRSHTLHLKRLTSSVGEGSMTMVEGSVQIAAPRQAVWDLLADPRRHTELGTFVAAVTVLTEGEVREGTVYRERSGPGFMKSESEWTVTRFDPPHELVHTSGDPSMPAEATWTLEEVDVRSTKVTQALDFEMLPRFRPLGRLLEAAFAKRLMERETARMLHDLKRIVEARAPETSGSA